MGNIVTGTIKNVAKYTKPTLISVRELLYSTNSKELFAEYYKEGNRGLLPEGSVSDELYCRMEDAGLLDVFAVYNALGIIQGFIVASTSILPHYNTLGTTVMSIFVRKEFRKFGMAKKLIDAVEVAAKVKGSSAVIISSPIDSKFGVYLNTLKYKATNTLYGKALNE